MALIVVPFALVGVESLLSGGGVQYVAEVGSDRIPATELQLQINQQKRRLLMTMGENIDPSLLDDQLLAGPSLEFLIQKSLLIQAAADYDMSVSDQALVDFIADMDVFKVNGRFDEAMFRRVVADQGYSPAGFQAALKQDMLMTQLRSGIAGSTFATTAEVELLAAVAEEKRDIRYMVLPIAQFRSDAEVTEERIQAAYEANSASYMTEETVVLDYVELTTEDFLGEVDEDEVRELYELERDAWRQPEQRRVAHILITPGSDESPADAEARVAAIQNRLAAGEAFADVAADASDDVGSASAGGELGFTDGSVFPEPMEEAIAQLDVGAISEPVQTEAGRHIIKLLELRPGEVREFADVRAELERRLASEAASRDLIQAVERLKDLAFNAEDLDRPAEQIGVEVEVSEPVSRSSADPLFSNGRLLAAAFSTEVLEDGFNSEVIELDAEHFVALRVRRHNLPELRPLAEVKSQIVAQLRDEIAREQIRAMAEQVLAELRAGSSIEALAQSNDYEWQVELATTRNNPSAPDTLLRRAFRLAAPEEGQSTFDYVQNSEGDVEIFELVRVLQVSKDRLPAGRQQLIERQLISEHGQQADQNFLQQLRTDADITRS